jgi:hypothetical protein
MAELNSSSSKQPNIFTKIVDKVKSIFNIGYVNVSIECPEAIKRVSQGEFSGNVTITAKKDVSLKNLKVDFVETYTKGTPGKEGYIIKTYPLGVINIDLTNTPLSKDASKTVPFTLGFRLAENLNDELKAHGGLVGGLGKLGSFMDKERSTFTATAYVDIAEATFSVSDYKNIKLN